MFSTNTAGAGHPSTSTSTSTSTMQSPNLDKGPSVPTTDSRRTVRTTYPINNLPHSVQGYLTTVGKSINTRADNISKAINKTLAILGRGGKLLRTISLLAYYRNSSPEVIRSILEQGGLYGKLAQLLAQNPEVLVRLVRSSDGPAIEDFLEKVIEVLSQYPQGVIPPEQVVSTLKKSSIPDDVEIQYVRNLGRGTVCQVDDCLIDGMHYAVKCVSPELSRAIKGDASIASGIFIPMLKWLGLCSDLDVHGDLESVKMFVAETSLEVELANTLKQIESFAELSKRQSYGFQVLRTVEICNPVSSRTREQCRKRKRLKDDLSVVNHKRLKATDPLLHKRFVSTERYRVPLKFKVPMVYPNFSSGNVLVMELINGCLLDDKNKIENMLTAWRPAWNQGKALDSRQKKQILQGLRKQIVNAFLNAARHSDFINTDFHTGNIILKLEDQGIAVYFIDHGNCMDLNHVRREYRHTNYHIAIHSLIKFFLDRLNPVPDVADEYRVSAKKARLEDNCPNAAAFELSEKGSVISGRFETNVESSLTTLIKDLTLIPWSSTVDKALKDMIDSGVFDAEANAAADQKKWFLEERSVGEICEKYYDWVTTEFDLPPEKEKPARNVFVNDMILFLYRQAVNLKAKTFNNLCVLDQIDIANNGIQDYVASLGYTFESRELNKQRLDFQIKQFISGQ